MKKEHVDDGDEEEPEELKEEQETEIEKEVAEAMEDDIEEAKESEEAEIEDKEQEDETEEKESEEKKQDENEIVKKNKEPKVENEEENENIVCSYDSEKSVLGHYFAFIGTVVHELAHYIACLIVGAKVVKVELLLPPGKRHLGSVMIHNRPLPFESWFIAVAPFLLGNVIGFLLFIDAVHALETNNWLYLLIVVWLGASITWRARASGGDLKHAWKAISKIPKRYNAGERIFITLLLPIIYISLFVMEVRDRYFTHGIGGLAWIAVVVIIAKAYAM